MLFRDETDTTPTSAANFLLLGQELLGDQFALPRPRIKAIKEYCEKLPGHTKCLDSMLGIAGP